MAVYTIDFEFIEDNFYLEIISIGIVSEDGRELYRCLLHSDYSEASSWVKDNVIPHLPKEDAIDGLGDAIWVRLEDLAHEINHFFKDDEHPIIYADYGGFDYVCFCWVFGSMMKLPSKFEMFFRELRVSCIELGIKDSDVPQIGTLHSAIDDAKWNMALLKLINTLEEVNQEESNNE
jgi:hypothetical protein